MDPTASVQTPVAITSATQGTRGKSDENCEPCTAALTTTTTVDGCLSMEHASFVRNARWAKAKTDIVLIPMMAFVVMLQYLDKVNSPSALRKEYSSR